MFTYIFDDSYFTWAKAGLNVDYQTPTDAKPVITFDSTAAAEGDVATLSIEDSDVVVIAVTNAATYSTNITWYFNGAALSGSYITGTNNGILTVSAGVAPFTVQGKFPLTIIGTPATGAPSSIVISIEITE